MNRPPENFVRVDADVLHAFSSQCLERAGLLPEHATQLAQLLVNSDLRGVVSHGTRALPGYCRTISQQHVNTRPQITIVQESDTSILLDGDGSLGYAPTMQLTEACIIKAKQAGVAVGAVQGIGHYGSAGHYVRRAMEEDLIGFSVQGAYPQYYQTNEGKRAAKYGNPPLCFGLPGSQHEAPLILDGATCILADYQRGEEFEELEKMIPAAFFKSIGYTAVGTALGGAFVGQASERAKEIHARWPGARQGAMIWLMDAGLFAPVAQVKDAITQMSALAAEQMIPVGDYDEVLLPGGVEHRLEKTYGEEGIKIGAEQEDGLKELAEEFEVEIPWRRAES
jgi:L-2-hydroxycarboxylate dehydrogenase (NAD+)